MTSATPVPSPAAEQAAREEQLLTMEEVTDLLFAGQRRGYVTNEEMSESLDGLELSPVMLDGVKTLLRNEGVDIVDVAPAREAAEPDTEAIDRAERQRLEELALRTPTSDPVRMYLREIGHVPLRKSVV